jgi:hypothetical protein
MSISSPVDFIGVPPRSWSAHQLHHTDASHLYVTSTWGLSLSFLLVAWGLSMALYGDFYMALDSWQHTSVPAGPQTCAEGQQAPEAQPWSVAQQRPLLKQFNRSGGQHACARGQQVP